MSIPGPSLHRTAFNPKNEAAFEDFLTSFKSSQAENEILAQDALQDLNLDEDGTSDEYDFIDDVEDGTGRRSRRRDGENGHHPKIKYMNMLQKVADRELNQVTIDLDDLVEVFAPILCT